MTTRKEKIWWLSFAAPARGCGGVVLVEAESLKDARSRVRQLRLAPPGDWQVEGYEVPSEVEEQYRPYLRQLLTEEEARLYLQGKTYREWSAQDHAAAMPGRRVSEKLPPGKLLS